MARKAMGVPAHLRGGGRESLPRWTGDVRGFRFTQVYWIYWDEPRDSGQEDISCLPTAPTFHAIRPSTPFASRFNPPDHLATPRPLPYAFSRRSPSATSSSAHLLRSRRWFMPADRGWLPGVGFNAIQSKSNIDSGVDYRDQAAGRIGDECCSNYA